VLKPSRGPGRWGPARHRDPLWRSLHRVRRSGRSRDHLRLSKRLSRTIRLARFAVTVVIVSVDCTYLD